jgi:ubiquinone biosynthesis protein COQ9
MGTSTQCPGELSNLFKILKLKVLGTFVVVLQNFSHIQANPANAPTSFKQRAMLMDEIWHAVGDSSSDIDWYAKRGVLAAVYTATELYMLTDYSTGTSQKFGCILP